jgi:glycosyltransferase involved in cell wall biosynthesis
MSEGFKLQISIEELQKRKLFLAVPMYGGQCAGMFTRSVADLSAVCTKHGIPLQLFFLFNESLVTRARNYCVDEFMRSGATHLMFIDSDIGFNPQDVIAMLAMQSDESPYDVIGGPYPKKCISWEKIKQAVDKGMADENPNQLEKYVGDYVFNPKTTQREIPLNQPVEVLEIGTGFMMVRRKTFEDYQKAYPHLYYKPDHVRTEHFDGTREIMAYFDCVIDRGYGYENLHQLLRDVAEGKEGLQDIAKRMVDGEQHSSKRYLSEDYMFCYNVQRMGGKVFFCPWMQLQHVGSYVFGGSLADLASIGASATADTSKLKHKSKK